MARAVATSGQQRVLIVSLRQLGHAPALVSAPAPAAGSPQPRRVLWSSRGSVEEEHGMNRRRACLAALILAPWLAFAGAALVGYELLTGHRLLRMAAGCGGLGGGVRGGGGPHPL